MRRLSRFVVSREALLANRWIRPFAHRLSHPSLWHLNRRSFARGVALGLAAAFLVPIGQIAVAALLAVSLRANLVVAATATFVTNPLTFPPIYYAAYRTGSLLLGLGHSNGLTGEQVVALAEQATATVEPSGWALFNVLLPLGLGLGTFAALSSVVGFWLAWTLWTMRVKKKWRRRVRPMP